MGRKDLSRTVIEGGRYYRNCWERRASHAIGRARTREWLDRVRWDVEEAEDTVPDPTPTVRKMFRDKLGPARRWIDAQVGRNWNAVRSELFAKFDTRTVAGRHVVFDHMLGEVSTVGKPRGSPYVRADGWYVDAAGILRRAEWMGLSYRRLAKRVYTWRGARRAALTPLGWWWFDFVESTYCWKRPCSIPHDKDGRHVARCTAARAMTRGELRYLERLPAGLRAICVSPFVELQRLL